MNILKYPYWSPYYTGILIGLLQIPLFYTLHASIGSSMSFHSIACSIISFFSGTNEQAITTRCFPMPKHWWQVGFVIGIVIGAYVSARLSHTKRFGIATVWSRALVNFSVFKRFSMAFIAGIIMLLGARIADGCTSGNGISGIALLSVGSVLVITCMFMSGIVVAHCYKKI